MIPVKYCFIFVTTLLKIKYHFLLIGRANTGHGQIWPTDLSLTSLIMENLSYKDEKGDHYQKNKTRQSESQGLGEVSRFSNESNKTLQIKKKKNCLKLNARERIRKYTHGKKLKSSLE